MARAKPKARRKTAARKTPRSVAVDKTERYCQLRATGESPSAAYRAVYAREGSKPETIWTESWKQEQRPEVTQRINALREIHRKALNEQFAIDVTEWTREVLIRAMADTRRLVDPVTGRILQPHELDDQTAKVVEGFDVDEDGLVRKYRTARRGQFLDMLGKRLGAYLPKLGENAGNEMAALMAFLASRSTLQPVPDVEFKERVIVDVNQPAPGALVPVERDRG